MQYTTELVDLMKEYGMELKPLGSDKFITYCKWHNDTGTPNLVVYPETNSAYCFACCKCVTPVDVIMHFENVDYTEAMKRLYGSGYEWHKLQKKATTSNEVDVNYMYKILSRNFRKKVISVISNDSAVHKMQEILYKHTHSVLASDKLFQALKEIKNIN